MRRRDARRAELERKLDEDLVILHRGPRCRRSWLSPIASTGEQGSAHASAVEAMLARPNSSLGAQSHAPDSVAARPLSLDAQRGTENFDPLFRHEIGFVFFQAARSLVDRRGDATTPAEIEAGSRRCSLTMSNCCENLAAGAALSIWATQSEARLLQNDAAIGRALPCQSAHTRRSASVMLRSCAAAILSG